MVGSLIYQPAIFRACIHSNASHDSDCSVSNAIQSDASDSISLSDLADLLAEHSFDSEYRDCSCGWTEGEPWELHVLAVASGALDS